MANMDAIEAIADTLFRKLCQAVAGDMERLPVPGVAVGVLHDGQEHIAGFGVTSIEHPLPVTADTLFQVGSITKTFTATAIMRLVEMGKLDLDVPVHTYLPGLHLADEEVAAQVTIRHLLMHTGGWEGDYFNDLGCGDDALAKMVAKVADLPQLTPLGAVWSYNNAGFYLAGRIVEVVTGQGYEAALKELVLDPLGLNNSFFFAHDVITHRFAVGHNVRDNQPVVARPWAIGRAAHPIGGLVCNIADLFRYARFHMGDGTVPDGRRLLKPETLRLMQTPVLPTSGLNLIGLSWFVTPLGEITLVGHGGGTNGQITDFRMAPANNFAFAIFSNSGDGEMLVKHIRELALDIYFGVAWPKATPLAVPQEKLAPYLGRYVTRMEEMEISLHDGALMLQVTFKGGFPKVDSPPHPSPPPMAMAFYDDDRIIGLEGPLKDERGEFVRRPDGSIGWLRLGGRVHVRL